MQILLWKVTIKVAPYHSMFLDCRPNLLHWQINGFLSLNISPVFAADLKTALVLACAARATSSMEWRSSLQQTWYCLLSSWYRWTPVGMGWSSPQITELVCSRPTSKTPDFFIPGPLSYFWTAQTSTQTVTQSQTLGSFSWNDETQIHQKAQRKD